MDLSITQVPVWLSALFIVSVGTFPVILIANATKTAYQNENLEKSIKLKRNVIIFYWLFLVIVSCVSLTGFYEKNVLPPRILFTTALPLLLFYKLYILRTNWFKLVFKHISLDQLIYIHIFRFIGVFFFLGYAYDVLPKTLAFIGGTGDILTAALAIPVVIALRKGLSFAKKIAWIWNFIGILDIAFVLSTVLILTKLSIENNESSVQQFVTFPFSWIPAFAPATIIFLHLLVFKKLNEKPNK